MRGKNRIGWGIGVIGLGITVWLGVAALPHFQFPFWWLVPSSLALAGLFLLGSGGLALLKDETEHRRIDRDRKTGRLEELDAEVFRIHAELGQQQHFLRVATDYGDELRAEAIRATVKDLETRAASALREADRLR